MATYGLNYMGSKNKIAEWVLSYLPKADNLYDLFCGGCAITHCAIEQRKYKNYHINDIRSEMPFGFIDCINGKYHDDKRWISREDFHELKGKGDLLVDLCYSFGGNFKDYAFSKDNEQKKKALHYAIMFDDYSLMKDEYGIDLSPIKDIQNIQDKYIAAKTILKQRLDLKDFKGLYRIQNLERLQRMISLENIHNSIVATSKSYDEIEIKPNSVIYLDPPYRNRGTYNEEPFDYDKFYDWCLKQTEPLYISEYWMPESDFVCISQKSKICGFSKTNNSLKTTEKIFVPKHQKEMNEEWKLFSF